MTIVIQINGKVRDRFEVPMDMKEEDIKSKVKERELIKRWIKGKKIKKIIYVPCKLVNIVI